MQARKIKWIGLGISMILGMLSVAPWIGAATLSPGEILDRVDRNSQYQSAYTEAAMEITLGGRKITKTLRTWAEGNQKALVEFTSKRDQGTRILKLGDDLWLYSPTAESEVKLSGEMLKQGMAGSDFSYQDALENEKLRELYQANAAGDETIGGRPCYVLELVAKPGVEVSYYRRKIWVDEERFVGLKEELYAPSGKLLKVSTTEKVELFGSRYYPTVVVMEDKLRKNSSTRFTIDTIQFNVTIPAGTFTRQRLTGR
ncbi:MAG TPA: outer membrane lipoprotein-sorting protein [Bacillota bacterium]